MILGQSRDWRLDLPWAQHFAQKRLAVLRHPTLCRKPQIKRLLPQNQAPEECHGSFS